MSELTVVAPMQKHSSRTYVSPVVLNVAQKRYRVRRLVAKLCFAVIVILLVQLLLFVPVDQRIWYVFGILSSGCVALLATSDYVIHHAIPWDIEVSIEEYLAKTLGKQKTMTQDRHVLAAYLCALLRERHTHITVSAQKQTNLKTGVTEEVILGPVTAASPIFRETPKPNGLKRLV